MPPCADGPVPIQQAVAVPDGVLAIERSASGGICTRMVGHRHISLQTDSTNVLGIDLDRSDNVQIVKRKMQPILNVPMEQVVPVLGDSILQNFLSKVRNDTPILLTRGLQRSLSTPCLSFSPDAQRQVDHGQPVEVVSGLRCCSEMKKILKEIVEAIQYGAEPIPVMGGLGGAYCFRNTRGENVAIVKPTDEEPFAPNNPKGFVGKMLGQPGLKRAVRVGETGFREVAAYLLDHDHFAKVPPTILVKVAHQSFHDNNASNCCRESDRSTSTVAKIASCQKFVGHDFDASDLGSSRFSVSAVHRIGILDIRIYNTDRHAGNILVKSCRAFDRPGVWGRSTQLNEALELIPIDHGLCLPEAFEDPYFEWLHWPQASLPFSEEELDYISQLDETKDVEMLRVELPMLREACFRMLFLCTVFLKKAAAAGLCLAEIGEMMSRDGMEEASQLELLCLQAKLQVERELLAADSNEDDSISEYSFGEENYGEQFEVEMEKEEETKLHCAMDTNQLLPGRNEHFSSPTGLRQVAESIVPKKIHKGTSGNWLAVPFIISPSGGGSGGSEHQFHNLTVATKSSACGRKVWPSPQLHHPSASPRIPRGQHIPLEVLFEASPLEKDDLSWPLKSAAEISSLSSGYSLFGMSLQNKLNMSCPARNGADHSLKTVQDFTNLAEEEEVNLFTETSFPASMDSWTVDGVSQRAIPFRSSSFIEGKQSERRAFGTVGLSVSEATGKANAIGISNPVSLSDVSEEDWRHFVECFLEILQEALETKCKLNVSYRSRLGISCQF